MARLTPAEITAIAEPLELVYQNMTDELLINIARHLKGGWEDTATWEMKKLGQLGALTEESAKIIAKYTGQTEEEIRQAFLQAASLATADIDPVLAQAAAAGKLVDPGTTVATSRAMQDALRAYVEQATDKLNLTNTTMLTSTQQVYAQTVHTAAVTAQLEQAKAIIETKSAEVITGQETRTKAMRSALNQLNSAGITGFYDRIGRKWQPDAYVNMVIKTTAHNAAITAIRTRQQEYGGGDIFQISSHPGARPLCAPYQGGFYSWSGSGVFTDGAGHTHEYDDINHTSYGEAAGIFGINCGHHPIPMIDGFSFPQEYEELSEEENARIYAESQEQRQLERDIRAAKREEEVCKAAGDEAGAKAARQKVQQEQARMRQFIKDTGRVRRYDRESIGGGTVPTMPKVTPPKPATPAPVATNPTTTKSPGDDYKPSSDVAQRIGNAGIAQHRFDILSTPKTEEELIRQIGGGDQTNGSCSSCAFAYAAGMNGADIRDFRGGVSCKQFSSCRTIDDITLQFGGTVIKNTNDFTASHKAFELVENGHTYYFGTGKHSAIIRKREDTLQYLELQSRYEENIGWHLLNDNSLKRRFGAQRSHTTYGMKWENSTELIDVTQLKGDEFMYIMNFINTPESQQKKGASGGIK